VKTESFCSVAVGVTGYTWATLQRLGWIKEERVAKGARTRYPVNMTIGFVIDE
jgi:hypothetical protein